MKQAGMQKTEGEDIVAAEQDGWDIATAKELTVGILFTTSGDFIKRSEFTLESCMPESREPPVGFGNVEVSDVSITAQDQVS